MIDSDRVFDFKDAQPLPGQEELETINSHKVSRLTRILRRLGQGSEEPDLMAGGILFVGEK